MATGRNCSETVHPANSLPCCSEASFCTAALQFHALHPECPGGPAGPVNQPIHNHGTQEQVKCPVSAAGSVPQAALHPNGAVGRWPHFAQKQRHVECRSGAGPQVESRLPLDLAHVILNRSCSCNHPSTVNHRAVSQRGWGGAAHRLSSSSFQQPNLLSWIGLRSGRS